MFIAELFYVSETLFYVSTHTGILFFCYVCTADAFCTRLNKNNWIFKGSPDGGKSYTSNKVKDAMLIPETILMKTKQSDAALDDLDLMDYRNMMEEVSRIQISSFEKFILTFIFFAFFRLTCSCGTKTQSTRECRTKRRIALPLAYPFL
jgi:hypothetical protein